MVFGAAEMKTSFAAFAVSLFVALPLHKQFTERHVSTSKHSQIAVQGHHPLVGIQCRCNTGRDGFLANATEPFTDFTLAQKHQHFFFDHPWQEHRFIQISELLRC